VDIRPGASGSDLLGPVPFNGSPSMISEPAGANLREFALEIIGVLNAERVR